MSSHSSAYLATRLRLHASRLIKFPQLLEFIDFDLDRILAELRQVSGVHYDIEAVNAALNGSTDHTDAAC